MTDFPFAVRPLTEDDREAFLEFDNIVWSSDEEGPRDVLLTNVPIRGAFGAERDGELAGGLGSWDIEVAVPGVDGRANVVAVEGLTWVGVHPDHRRQGVLRELIARHLRWTRDEQHRPLSALQASEPGIYGRFGYGAAVHMLKASFGRGTTFAAPDAVSDVADATTTTLRTASPDDAERANAVARACAEAGGVGNVIRSEADLARQFTKVPEFFRGSEPRRILWATREGRDVGYATFRRAPKWDNGSPNGEVDLYYLGGVDAGARLALMRRMVDFDLMSSTTFGVSLDDPLVLWGDSVRSLGSGMHDTLWVRIADLPGAVAQRGYAADCDVRVKVTVSILGENDGVWRWQTSGGQGHVELATGQDPDLSLDIRDLGTVWLGEQTLAARQVAGFVQEHTADSVAALDAALRTPVRPSNTVGF